MKKQKGFASLAMLGVFVAVIAVAAWFDDKKEPQHEDDDAHAHRIVHGVLKDYDK